MSKKIRVAIVEDNRDYCECIKSALEEKDNFEVVGIAHDGNEGLKLLQENEVDVALLDLVLPEKDGLYILEELSSYPDKKTSFIMISAISQEHITKKALELGADYYIMKPFDMEVLARRIVDIYEYKNGVFKLKALPQHPIFKNSIEEYASEILHKIPISTNLKGYSYLKMAIVLSINDRKMLEGVTKILYPTVAKKFNTTSSRVERAIRHAIDTAWAKGNGNNYFSLLKYGSPNRGKPTNSAFIAAVTELYNLQYSKTV